MTWSCSEAEVVCKQLGYLWADTFSVGYNYGDEIYGKYLWRNVNCSGEEERLVQCQYEDIGDQHWGVSYGGIVGVSCHPAHELSTTTPAPTTTPPDFCPSGWLDAGNLGCFLLHANMTADSWFEANLLCESLGGYLLEPRTEDMQQLISTLLTMLPEVSGSLDSWWIGLSDLGHEGSWLWLHQAEFAEEMFWADGFPENSPFNDADCAVLSKASGYMWQDMRCEAKRGTSPMGVICQL